MKLETYVEDDFYRAFISEISSKRSDSSTGESFSTSCITPQDWQNWFSRWLLILGDSEPNLSFISDYEIGLRLTNDQEIRNLNSLYRHQDKPTDVLAFAALETDIPQPADIYSNIPIYLGDIVISVTTAYEQAKEQKHSLNVEIAWLAVHGLLHLIGWDHPDEEALDRMLNQQAILLKTSSIYIDV